MNESDPIDTALPPEPPPPALPDPPRSGTKLSGLRQILNARKIERKVLSREINIDLNRFLGIVGAQTRAAPEEINKLIEALEVTFEELIAPDTSPPSHRKRAPNPSIPIDADDDELDSEAPAEDVSLARIDRAAVPALPVGDITLNIALPDGRRYAVSSNQPVTPGMLERMSRALFVLLRETED